MHWFFLTVSAATTSCKKGCTDEMASNYSQKAKKDNGTCLFDGESEELNGGSNLGNQEVEIAPPQSILGEETAHSNNDNDNVIAFPTNCCT